MKKFEDMTTSELLKQIKKIHAEMNFSPQKLNQTDGIILLDKNNPNDRDWFKNDKAYDIIKKEFADQ